MIATYAAIGLFASAWVLLYFMRRDTLSRGKTEEENLILRKTNESLSNRPLTDADLIDRLRERAANERKNLRNSDNT